MKQSILFVCTGNACRSQMAEGLMRQLAADRFDVFSAGSHPAGYIHAYAIAAMREIDVDITTHQSKSIEQFAARSFDYIITVCDFAKACIPRLPPATHILHWPLQDPAALFADEAAGLKLARKVRDRLRKKLEKLLRAATATPPDRLESRSAHLAKPPLTS